MTDSRLDIALSNVEIIALKLASIDEYLSRVTGRVVNQEVAMCRSLADQVAQHLRSLQDADYGYYPGAGGGLY